MPIVRLASVQKLGFRSIDYAKYHIVMEIK